MGRVCDEIFPHVSNVLEQDDVRQELAVRLAEGASLADLFQVVRQHVQLRQAVAASGDPAEDAEDAEDIFDQAPRAVGAWPEQQQAIITAALATSIQAGRQIRFSAGSAEGQPRTRVTVDIDGVVIETMGSV